AVVDRAEASSGTDGCAGGWYRIAPRGYVCVGNGASLSVEHPVVQAAVRGPRRLEPLPYEYVTSKYPPPPLYFKLPTRADQERVEGPTLGAHIATSGGDVPFAKFTLDEVPAFLAQGKSLPKPYGANRQLRMSTHA